MARTGTTRNSAKQQRINAELETIIEEFGRAMRDANRACIAEEPACSHDNKPRFTLNMEFVWSKYVNFCLDNPQ